MIKKIAVLGSTGSIGTNALRVIEALGPEYKIAALSAHSNIELLAQQAKKFKPDFVAVTNPQYAGQLQNLMSDSDTEILTGPEGLVEIARLEDVDIILAAVVGSAGLPALLAAAETGKKLAIANKEPLVMAGQMLLDKTKQSGGSIIPVDSEHSAIFQAMQAGQREEIHKIILTASGGPFREFSLEDIENATLEQALVHPVWNMGPKITIDSATMMNKAFEVIEARWLFDMPVEKLKVLVHPESIIHSLVEFVDGSIIAQLGKPDMCLPIQYALTYPKRVPGIAKRLRLEEVGSLTFHEPNLEVFRALKLGFEVARIGGTTAVVFNAANEAAVEEFLAGRIRFVTIVELIEDCLNNHTNKSTVCLEELLEADAWARKQVKNYLHSGNKSII
jgi:1-deoxy-D-xylulose-5-phosphate reductoisomerase